MASTHTSPNRGALNNEQMGPKGIAQHPLSLQAESKKAACDLEGIAPTVTARMLVRSARGTQKTIEIMAHSALVSCGTNLQGTAAAVAEFAVLNDLIESWFSGDYQEEFPHELPIVAAMKGFLRQVDGGVSKSAAWVM